MVIDLTLIDERAKNFDITNNENEFEKGRNLLITGEMEFNNRNHVENTLKYFFNMTKKHFNEGTKDNLYIHDAYLYNGDEREEQYKKTAKRYIDINFEKLRQSLFYINFDSDDVTEIDLKEVAREIEDFYKKISEKFGVNFKNMTYVFHFNQGCPHVHVIYEVVV